jgi:hypothetical protein
VRQRPRGGAAQHGRGGSVRGLEGREHDAAEGDLLPHRHGDRRHRELRGQDGPSVPADGSRQQEDAGQRQAADQALGHAGTPQAQLGRRAADAQQAQRQAAGDEGRSLPLRGPQRHHARPLQPDGHGGETDGAHLRGYEHERALHAGNDSQTAEPTPGAVECQS